MQRKRGDRGDGQGLEARFSGSSAHTGMCYILWALESCGSILSKEVTLLLL